MPDEQGMLIEMAVLKEQVSGVREDVHELKNLLRETLTMQRTVTQHAEALKALQEGDQRAGARLDSHAERQKKHEERTEQELRRIEAVAANKIEEVWKYSRNGFEQVSTFQNRLRGGMIVVGALLGLLGGVMVSGGAWLVGTVNEGSKNDATTKQEIAELRRMVTRTEIKVDGK